MARRGRPTEAMVLSDDERETLERWARRPKSANALATRRRIVLACADGATNREVAARLEVRHNTVSKWRHRFLELRLDGLWDDPRPGAPRTASDADVERVIVKTGGGPGRCDALVDPLDGQGGGDVPDDGLEDRAEEHGHKAGTAQRFGRDLRAVIPGLRVIRPGGDDEERLRVYRGLRFREPKRGAS